MTPTPEWPGLSAVIHHTLYRHTLLPVEHAAQRLRIRPHDLCVWARECGVTIHVSTSGFLIEEAALESALTCRPVASRIRELRTGKQ